MSIIASQQGSKCLYQTSAAFVSARLDVINISPITAQDLNLEIGSKAPGGIIVADSYVP